MKKDRQQSVIVPIPLLTIKLKAQATSNLVLLPSGPDTIRKHNLALRPCGNNYHTIFVLKKLVITSTIFWQLFFFDELPEKTV